MDLIGNEHAKRVFEIAVKGKFNVGIVTNPRMFPLNLTKLLNNYVIVYPCPCGNFLNPESPCICSIEDITKYNMNNKTRLENCEMVVELIKPKFEEVSKYFNLNSILVGTSRSLFKTAYVKLNLWPNDVEHILSVSKTIAEMDGKTEIEIQHLAEAIQYKSLLNRT